MDEADRTPDEAVAFTPFLTDHDYEELRWYLEEYMDLPRGGAIVRAEQVEKQLKTWGRGLFDRLFPEGAHRDLIRTLLESPEPRTFTIATNRHELLRIPWELLADETGHLAQRVSVRRQLSRPETPSPRDIELPLRILYLVSRPADADFFDPRMTTGALLDALDPIGPDIHFNFCSPPSLAQLDEELSAAERAGRPYHIVHFDGHGTFLPEAQIGALCFERPGDAATDLIPADRLGDLLVQYQIHLVVLEACRDRTADRLAGFGSVAPQLIRSGVGSVLSTGYAFQLEAARIFMDRFYRELICGAKIGHAVALGRSALRATNTRWLDRSPQGERIALEDWFLPHLYQRAGDESLFRPRPGEGPSLREYDVFLSHNHNESDRVEQIARRLTDDHGLRIWLDKWESRSGPLKPQCEAGIRDSRITVVVVSEAALESDWVNWEIETHQALNPDQDRLLPIKFEPVELPDNLNRVMWLDFTDPDADPEQTGLLAQHIRLNDAEDARRRRGFRPPQAFGQPGGFPRPPQFGFQGRARELHHLQRRFSKQRGIVLHAMGGMGKTALATEAAHWWTRSGRFRDGACFISFEQFMSADRVVQIFGLYCEGPKFDQRPQAEQRLRAIEFFTTRDIFMVWDNFESVLAQFNAGSSASPGYHEAERVRIIQLFHDLTRHAGRGRLLVTCRPGETGLPAGAGREELFGFARPDSLWLLHNILESRGHSLRNPALSRERVDSLLDALVDHPLSLELVGPHLTTRPLETIEKDFADLLTAFEQEADEDRNRSLLASLEFSRRQLSPPARAALPWLGLFKTGVFEDLLLDISKIEPEAWGKIRAEFESVALLRTENELHLVERPFLRFHPTLPFASSHEAPAREPEVRKRFIDTYRQFKRALNQAIGGSQPLSALRFFAREEANYRTAVDWAVTDGDLESVADLGYLMSSVLETSRRNREYDAWIGWLKKVVGSDGFSLEAASYERQYAWTMLTGGEPGKALAHLEQLIQRLDRTTDFDPTFQLALAVGDHGRMLDYTGNSDRAVGILRDSIERWERLIEHEAGTPWPELTETGDVGDLRGELCNLSATMGDLANALCQSGHFDEALDLTVKTIRISDAIGDHLNLAASNAQYASILVSAGRTKEADARYEEALRDARKTGHRRLEASLLQHQGTLAADNEEYDRAVRIYGEALQVFAASGDNRALTETYSLIAMAEQDAGRYAEGWAWYEKARELAEKINDRYCVAVILHNMGTLRQMEGKAAREQ
ncbi:MAG: TIR domain-containing protein, partial [Verrucomicrobiota bacterium]